MTGHVEFRIVCNGKRKRRVLMVFQPVPHRDSGGVWVGSRAELLALGWESWDGTLTYNLGKRAVQDKGAATLTGGEWSFWCGACHFGWEVPDAELGRTVIEKARLGVSEADITELKG